MALGKRRREHQELWVSSSELPRSAGHPFYRAMNRLLLEAEFDDTVEALCASYYSESVGRPSIPPGVYFRMLLVGYFEGIDSQRGIAWRSRDSLSLREFLGLSITDKVPDHSSLTVIRKRLPLEVHEKVFQLVLSIAKEKGLLRGKAIGIDGTLLEANAAMRSIVRRGSGEDWKQYLVKVAKEAGIENPSDEELKKFDQNRPSKSVSNQEWESRSDPQSRIMKMKDGTTHLAYKSEHAVDLETEIIVAATVHPGDESDPKPLEHTLEEVERNTAAAGSDTIVEAVAADSGYHKTETWALLAEAGIRTDVSERGWPKRRWEAKPRGWRAAVLANRRRQRGRRGQALQRRRREWLERSFAHVCETGRARRTWIRGVYEVTKRYLVQVAARNLGLILRKAFGIGSPRSMQGFLCDLCRRLGRRIVPRAELKATPHPLAA